MQLNFQGVGNMALEFIEIAFIVKDSLFTHLPRPEMAADMLDEKLPATIPPQQG